MLLEDVIQVARGEVEADLLLKNAQVVNVFSGDIHRTNVAISHTRVVGFGQYRAKRVIDLDGRYVAPGLIDAHVHIESSMVSVPEYARTVVPHGTTTVIIDPHEIANVLGLNGIRFMLESSKDNPLSVHIMIPSCVPATPLDEHGEYDYESLHALNLSLLNEQVLALMDGQEVTLPHYNFQTGKGETGQTVSLSPQHIIIAEGLHGMNPALLPQVPAERIYRIYASCLTQLNIDYHNRVPTTDTRLLRRMVRDARSRGYSAQETIARWESVRRGESRNVFPFQEYADTMFNSALVYELAVLKPFAEPLLRQVEPGTMEYIEARRLLAFLEWLLPCPPDSIPDNSLLREFIGGSILENYTPW